MVKVEANGTCTQRSVRLAVTIVPLIGLCWLGMMMVHELGHVVAAWGSGGSVTKVVLHPLAISRTDVEPNPHPLVVVWAGPLVGVLLPLLAWQAAAAARVAWAYLVRFFAGFCLIANGAYIGAGSFDGVGDCGEMLRAGTPIWVLWLFGVSCVLLGLRVWHRLGTHFGLSRDASGPSRKVGVVLWTFLFAVVATQCWLSAPE